jgi:hypothetical protein
MFHDNKWTFWNFNNKFLIELKEKEINLGKRLEVLNSSLSFKVTNKFTHFN